MLFALLLTTWGFLRLVVLPFWIIHSMLCALVFLYFWMCA